MQKNGHREEHAEKDPKRQVNPAARHDSGRSPANPPEKSDRAEQVPPVQEEPLDPLGPGGIGG